MTTYAAVRLRVLSVCGNTNLGNTRCSQAETDVLAQNAVVLRYAVHFILTQRAQKNASFSGISIYVLAHLQLARRLEYLPLTTAVMRQAALFWEQAWQQSQPTASNEALDGDMILAVQAITLGVPDVVIATTNVGHSSRFVPAVVWQSITSA
jgi:hypothetical protein